MLKRVQLISQIVFFILFCILFFFFNTFRTEIGSSGLALFLRLNPFITLLTSLASRSIFIPYLVLGAITIIVTILMGRVFCGMVCPLGSIIDFTDKIFRGKEKKKQPLRPPEKLQGLKYVIMILMVVLAILGMTFPLFMDPLLLVTRFFTLLIRPAVLTLATIIPQMNVEKLMTNTYIMKGAYAGAISAFILLMIILLGALFDRRFWCQYICPSGAFFGLLSRFSIFTRKIDLDKCNCCSICCDPRCPTRAISGEKFDVMSTAECILCGECSADKRQCSSFGFRMPSLTAGTGPDIGRRHAVSGIVSGLLLAPVLARTSPKKKPFVPGPIRPPGAIEEHAFLARCITCEACVSVCPQNALHPSTIGEDGFLNWNTPKLVPRIGFCQEDCTRCSEACPTGALLPITVEEKKTLKIGTAYVERGICRPWRMQYKCMICAKKCPYDAIEEKVIVDERGKEYPAPVVNKRKCVGCGICEYYCPIKGESAIKVFAYGEKRKKITEKEDKPGKKA